MSIGLLAAGIAFFGIQFHDYDDRVLGDSVSSSTSTITSTIGSSTQISTGTSTTSGTNISVSNTGTSNGTRSVSNRTTGNTSNVTSTTSTSNQTSVPTATSASTTVSGGASSSTTSTSAAINVSSVGGASTATNVGSSQTTSGGGTTGTGMTLSTGTSMQTALRSPTVPTDIGSEIIGQSIVRVKWQSSTGGIGALRYRIFRNGMAIGNTENRYFDDAAVEPGKRYEYAVQSIDSEKNVSGLSGSVAAFLPTENEQLNATRDRPFVLTVGTVPVPESVFMDADGDGLSDAEEARLGTDLNIRDTDGDGFSDGEEVRGGFDPLKYSPGDKRDKIQFQAAKDIAAAPELKTEREDTRYTVTKVENRISPETNRRTTVISGKGLPNAYLTLYIYSDPIVVTVLTDGSGNWQYDLDRSLEDGNHEVYVAVTDNMGRITAQSKSLPFIKTAEAVTVTPETFAVQVADEGNRSSLSRELPVYVAIGTGIAVLFVLLSLTIIRRRMPPTG